MQEPASFRTEPVEIAALNEAEAIADHEHQVVCDLINEGNTVVYAADALAVLLVIGDARLSDVQALLQTDLSNPYANVSSLVTACMLMGIDPATGKPGLPARTFLDGVRSGLSTQAALDRACVPASAILLWVQDRDFRSEVAQLQGLSPDG